MAEVPACIQRWNRENPWRASGHAKTEVAAKPLPSGRERLPFYPDLQVRQRTGALSLTCHGDDQGPCGPVVASTAFPACPQAGRALPVSREGPPSRRIRADHSEKAWALIHNPLLPEVDLELLPWIGLEP